MEILSTKILPSNFCIMKFLVNHEIFYHKNSHAYGMQYWSSDRLLASISAKYILSALLILDVFCLPSGDAPTVLDGYNIAVVAVLLSVIISLVLCSLAFCPLSYNLHAPSSNILDFSSTAFLAYLPIFVCFLELFFASLLQPLLFSSLFLSLFFYLF